MATKLGKLDSRAVTRETAADDPCYGKRLMIRLEAGGRTMSIWQKNCRRKFVLTYADVFRLAFQIAAREGVREAKRIRAERRVERLKLRRA
jgi:hypothetical protein